MFNDKKYYDNTHNLVCSSRFSTGFMFSELILTHIIFITILKIEENTIFQPLDVYVLLHFQYFT